LKQFGFSFTSRALVAMAFFCNISAEGFSLNDIGKIIPSCLVSGSLVTRSNLSIVGSGLLRSILGVICVSFRCSCLVTGVISISSCLFSVISSVTLPFFSIAVIFLSMGKVFSFETSIVCCKDLRSFCSPFLSSGTTAFSILSTGFCSPSVFSCVPLLSDSLNNVVFFWKALLSCCVVLISPLLSVSFASHFRSVLPI